MGFGYGNFSTIGGESSIMAKKKKKPPIFLGGTPSKKGDVISVGPTKSTEWTKKQKNKWEEAFNKKSNKPTRDDKRDSTKSGLSGTNPQQKEERPEKPTINLTPTKNPQVEIGRASCRERV